MKVVFALETHKKGSGRNDGDSAGTLKAGGAGEDVYVIVDEYRERLYFTIYKK